MKKPLARISLFISLVLTAGVYQFFKVKALRLGGPPYTIACGMGVCVVIEEDGTMRSFRGGSPDINPTVKWEDGVVVERSTHIVE